MVDRPSAAKSVYPHLPSAGEVTTSNEPRRNAPTSPLAQSMYPSLTPKPPPPAPRPKLTRDEIFRDFSNNMDPEYARMVGFRKVP
jgi:hypothetical protein